MNFSWRKLVIPTVTGVILTSCASTTKMVKSKPAILMSDRGVVPQPYAEPTLSSELESPINDLAAPVIFDPIELPVVNIVPPIKVAPPVTPEISTETYTVVKGDSLSRIAYKFTGFSYFQLAKVNQLDVKKPLKIGTVLNIPINGKRKTKAALKSTPKKKAKVSTKAKSKSKNKAKQPIPSDGKYTVKSGDSLWLVAHRFGLSIKEVKSLNNLKSDSIHPGNVLILKEGNSSPVNKPQVKKDVPVQPLAPITPIKEVVKPVALAPVVSPIQKEVKSAESSKDIFIENHSIVGPNETIKTIAELYGVKEELIRAQNQGVDFNNLKLGQIIEVPIEM